MKFGLYAMLLISLSAHANSNFGVWSTSCTDDDAFSINIESKPSPLVINDNQIVINAHSKEMSNNRIKIYYDNVADVGRGGMNFDWKSVSPTTPLAELNIENKIGELRWKGFYDIKKSKYYWVNDPDFVQSFSENGVIKLQQCKNNPSLK